tara:strand:- start:157 stop:1185 length:1029 start_codon:yes stop_codon:yes gene_type:complete
MRVISTIGPSCDTKEILISLKNAGCDEFRVNLSHASIRDMVNFDSIAKEIGINLAFDIEGAQIRTKVKNAINVQNNEKLSINLKDDSPFFGFSPPYVRDNLKIGDKLRIGFNGVLLEVLSKDLNQVLLEVLREGIIENNKGVDCINRFIELDDFTEKDKEAIALSNELNINTVYISFCNNVNPIRKIKEINPHLKIISKIETRLSIHNLEEICFESDGILIDRGDLSRELSVLDIPFAQRGIINVAKKLSTPCYVATNILDSLIDQNLPTRAELNDIVSNIELGASGIVLAAETAIGRKPLLCIEIVKELIHKFNMHKNGLLFADIERNEISDLGMKLWLNR